MCIVPSQDQLHVILQLQHYSGNTFMWDTNVVQFGPNEQV